MVTEFFDGAVEIGDAEVDDQIIDEGLALIRQLWDAGIAHRDIKPANLLVQDGHLHLIDVAFVQVRPSPWREAVDLANMMLVLAVRTDAERVYQRALAYFTPDEIAEAFAAARGIASPTQLRTVMKQDGRDLVAQFRALAPAATADLAAAVGAAPGPPRASGCWSPALLVVPGRSTACSRRPSCRSPTSRRAAPNDVMILMAQSVPTATAVPCIASLPAGWQASDVTISRDRGPFPAGDRATSGRGDAASAGRLRRSTVPSRSRATRSDMRRFERPTQLPPDARATRTYLSSGACVTYDFDLRRRRPTPRSSSSSTPRWRSSREASWSPRSNAATV